MKSSLLEWIILESRSIQVMGRKILGYLTNNDYNLKIQQRTVISSSSPPPKALPLSLTKIDLRKLSF